MQQHDTLGAGPARRAGGPHKCQVAPIRRITGTGLCRGGNCDRAHGSCLYGDFRNIRSGPVVGIRRGLVRNSNIERVRGPVEIVDVSADVADLARGALSVNVLLRGDDPQAVVPGVFVYHAKIVLLLFLLLFVGQRLGSGEGQPLAVGRDTIEADLALPVGEHFRLAAIHANSPQVGFAGTLRGEVDKPPVGRERGRRGALLAPCQLDPMRAVGIGQKDLRVHLALFCFDHRASLGIGNQPAIWRWHDIAHAANLQREFGSPASWRLSPG